jgi:hypothetical protein
MLEVPQPRSNFGTGPLHLLVDSTGLRLSGPGEWLVEKLGSRTRRSWRKLHIGVDADTGRIVAAALTTNDVDDGSQVGPLLDQIDAPVASFTADGAFDRNEVYDAVAARHPEAAVIVPPRTSTVLSDTADTARPASRDHCRARPPGLAESIRVQLARSDRGRYRALQAGDRGRAALADRRAPSDRGSHRHRRAEPHAEAGTPGVCPHRMIPKEGRTQSVHTADLCNNVAACAYR